MGHGEDTAAVQGDRHRRINQCTEMSDKMEQQETGREVRQQVLVVLTARQEIQRESGFEEKSVSLWI